MRDHMRRIMAGEMSLFTLSSNNAVVRMLGTGGPRVLTYQVGLVCVNTCWVGSMCVLCQPGVACGGQKPGCKV